MQEQSLQVLRVEGVETEGSIVVDPEISFNKWVLSFTDLFSAPWPLEQVLPEEDQEGSGQAKTWTRTSSIS